MRSRLLIAIGVVAAAALLTPEVASAQQEVPATATVGQGRSVKVGDEDHGAGKRGDSSGLERARRSRKSAVPDRGR